jgi:hypothetical protein
MVEPVMVNVWFTATITVAPPATAAIGGYRMGTDGLTWLDGSSNDFPVGSRVVCQIFVSNTGKTGFGGCGYSATGSDRQNIPDGAISMPPLFPGEGRWIGVLVVTAVSNPAIKPNPTEGKFYFDGSTCRAASATDTGTFYDSMDACNTAHKTTTGQDEIKKGIQDIENAHNIQDLMTGIGEVLGGIGDVIGGIGSDIGSGIWNSLPKSITDWFTNWVDFFTGIHEFFTTPGAFYRKHESALWESGSGTPIGMHVDSSSAYVKQRIADVKASQGSDIDIGRMIKDQVKAGFDSLGATFEAPVTVEGALDAATNAALSGLAVETTAAILALATEWIPTENLSGLAFIIQGIVNSFGTGRFVSGRLFGTYEANVGKQLEYALNEKYQHTLESLNELVSQRRKGLITNDDFTLKAIRVSGLTGGMVNIHYKNSLAVPTFDDLIVYARRHNITNYDFGAMQDLVGINYLDYRTYFDEHRWNDIPIRTLKMVYQAGAIPIGDVDSRIRRQGLRSDILPGDTVSDFQVMHNYVTESQEATLEKQLLQSTLKLFLEGKTDLAGLQAAASKVYSDPTQLTTYMATAQNKLEAEKTKAVKEKSFGYALLIKLAESGVDVTPFMDSDLTAENWDAAHRTAIEAYITATLAKKNLGVNGQPLAPA